MVIYSLLASLLLIFSLANAASESSPLSKVKISEILESTDRREGDRDRDSNRRPDKILDFIEITPGDSVVDLYAGGGWYTELFSRAVGETGVVYAHNDSLTMRFGGKEIRERTASGRLENVHRIDNVELESIDLPRNSIDIAFMGINYHDLFFISRERQGVTEIMREKIVDYKKALSTIKGMLKKDGTLIIIDHIAHAGSGLSAANDLHRIDPNIVKFQLAQTGFMLVEEAYYLRNPADDRGLSVFDPSIRGNTDRFIFKFSKEEP